MGLIHSHLDKVGCAGAERAQIEEAVAAIANRCLDECIAAGPDLGRMEELVGAASAEVERLLRGQARRAAEGPTAPGSASAPEDEKHD